MPERLRTSIAVTALVVAVLGWTPVGEATRSAVFPAHSVGTKQLKPNAVTSAKIRNHVVAGIDIRRGTINNAHIRRGSLLASSFRPGEIVSGPVLTDLEIVSDDTSFDAFPAKQNVIRCPTSKSVIGGGGAVLARDPDVAALTQNAPWDHASWWVGGNQLPLGDRQRPARGTQWGIRGYAICATVRGRPD